jgi:hypothetical protein
VNLPRILHAALASITFLNFQSASAAANTTAARVSEERQRDRSTAPAAAGARRNTGASPRSDESGKTGKAQQVKGQTALGNSDRVRPPLNRQATGHGTAVAANRRAATGRGAAAPTAAGNGARAASGNPGPSTANPSMARTYPAPGAASSAPNMTARRAAVALPQNPAVRPGTLGGPRAQASARLGGPASAKPAHAAALNGSQLQRPKY